MRATQWTRQVVLNLPYEYTSPRPPRFKRFVYYINGISIVKVPSSSIFSSSKQHITAPLGAPEQHQITSLTHWDEST